MPHGLFFPLCSLSPLWQRRPIPASFFGGARYLEGNAVAADRAALPYLKAALKDSDLEIARRAQRCVEAVESGAGITLELAAARLLAVYNPPGASEVVLNYLPFLDSEDVEEELLAALAA